MNISSVSKYIFVCVFLCFGASLWFCIIQHSFVDDRAYFTMLRYLRRKNNFSSTETSHRDSKSFFLMGWQVTCLVSLR